MVCISKCNRAAFNGKSGLAHKVDMPYLVTYLNQRLVFERHVVRCGSKSEYQKDVCSKEMDYVLKIYHSF